MTETSTTTITFADKLRVAADLIDAHPELPQPLVFAYTSGHVDVTWQLMNIDEAKDNQRDVAQQIIRTLGGKWSKKPWDDRFDFHQQRDGLTLGIFAHREQVCEAPRRRHRDRHHPGLGGDPRSAGAHRGARDRRVGLLPGPR